MAVSNSLTPKKETFSTFLTKDATKQWLNNQLGGDKGQKFMTAIVSAVSNNPALQGCEHSTILSAAMLGEALNLSPSPQLGQYYLIPFENRKNGRTVATFVLGYHGYLNLAMRSGYYKKINVIALKAGELIRYNPLEEEVEVKLIEDDEKREAMPSVGYYAMFEYVNGFKKVMYWSRAKMEAHATKYSKGYAGDKRNGTAWTFWSKDFDGMAFKTMLRQLISKWGIMSIDLQQAYVNDTAFVDESGKMNYVDNTDADNYSGVVFVDTELQTVDAVVENVPAKEDKPKQTAKAKPGEVIEDLFGSNK